MNVRINRMDLLNILKENRDEHLELYNEACVAYKKEMAAHLQKMVKKVQQAEDGEAVQVWISLPCPEEHTADFDRIIDMVEHDTRNELELSENEAAQYISNNWNWIKSFTSNTTSYIPKK